jgi:uncharacterized membrane protein YqaE (UPF0057 family)
MNIFFRFVLFILALVSLISKKSSATNIIVDPPSTLFSFTPTITSGPKIFIPFTPIVSPTISVKDALIEFKNTSRNEKKARVKAVKAAINEYKANKNAGDEPSTNQLLMIIIAILLPPLAVYLHEGELNTKFWISLILSLLVIFSFFLWIIPVLYSLLVVLDVI